MKHDGTKAALAQGAGRHRACRSPASAPTRTASCSSATTAAAAKAGFYTLEPTPPDAPPSTFPRKLSESGLFDVGEGPPDAAGRDPVLGQRPALVRRRCTRSGSSPCRPARRSTSPARAAGTSRTGRCSSRRFAARARPATRRRKWIETRFLTKQDGEWFGYTYVWNDGADRRRAGRRRRGWTASSRSRRDGRASRRGTTRAGPSAWSATAGRPTSSSACATLQMNKDHDYGGRTDNQLRTLEHLGMLKVRLGRRGEGGSASGQGLKGRRDEYVKRTAAAGPAAPKPSALLRCRRSGCRGWSTPTTRSRT